jgi:hypothetical protein
LEHRTSRPLTENATSHHGQSHTATHKLHLKFCFLIAGCGRNLTSPAENTRVRDKMNECGRKLRKKDDVLGKKQTRPSCFERIRLKNDVFFGRMRGKKCVFLARTRPISAAYGQNLVFFRRVRRNHYRTLRILVRICCSQINHPKPRKFPIRSK